MSDAGTDATPAAGERAGPAVRACACAPSRSCPARSCSSTSSRCRRRSATSPAAPGGRSRTRISDMTVRGAPAIGVTAAGGIALAAAEAAAASAGRPGRVPGRARAGRRAACWPRGPPPSTCAGRWTRCGAAWSGARRRRRAPRRRARRALLARAQAIHDDDIDRCLRIGEHGAALVQGRRPHPHALQRRRPGDGRLRHGARRHPLGRGRAPGHLRAGRRDAALAAGRPAHRLGAAGRGHPVPRSSPTTWPATSCSRGEVDGVVVGADRIAANGDTANKIGTYTRVACSPRSTACRSTWPRRSPPSTSRIDERRRDPHRGARPRPRSRASAACRSRPTGAARPAPGLRRHAGRQHHRHRHRGRRAAAAVRRRRWPRACGGGECRAVSAATPPVQGLHHGRRPRHAPVPAHRPHVQAHGAHPQPAGHGAPAAPAAAPRRHRGRRQPALPPGQDPRLLRRRLRVRRRAALQPRGASCWAPPAAPTRSASSSAAAPSSS